MKDLTRTPLRLVLRNFLNHIENLEAQSSSEESYDVEFQDLKLFSENVKTLKGYSCKEGEKEANRKKNRYKDILPFDASRVVLNEYDGVDGSDYINANYIKGASGSPAYIASQGPLPSTVNDFWRMVVQCEVQVIVMACNEEEAGKAKCEKYWVDEGEEKQFGNISVKLLKASTVCPDFSVRTMRLKYTNSQSVQEERTVCQLHYVAWPDHGVPSVVQPLLDMVRLVRDTQASETLPVLVHCSAGCGRTGTICAIDYVWGLLRTGKLTGDFSLLSLIREMRKQRIAMVQTKEQYVLVHQAVRELFKEQLCMIDSHPYENVDCDGLLLIKEVENEYDTIENVSVKSLEEKQDKNMEKDVAPPLPQKKHTLFSSKREKDVENLSAQQRDIHNVPKTSVGVSKSPGSPSKTIMHRNNSHFSHSDHVKPDRLLTPYKKVAPKPIPSKGILRVPQIDSIKSASAVKRSKSLKVVGCGSKQKLSCSTETPVESKRRSSLESNIEESISSLSVSDSNSKNSVEDITVKDDNFEQPSPQNSVSLRKYELLSQLDERRLLVRSYTTIETRKKSQDVPANKPIAQPYSAKCKLSRSNTQIDFAKVMDRVNPSVKQNGAIWKRYPPHVSAVNGISDKSSGYGLLMPCLNTDMNWVPVPQRIMKNIGSRLRNETDSPRQPMESPSSKVFALKRSPATHKNSPLAISSKHDSSVSPYKTAMSDHRGNSIKMSPSHKEDYYKAVREGPSCDPNYTPIKHKSSHGIQQYRNGVPSRYSQEPLHSMSPPSLTDSKSSNKIHGVHNYKTTMYETPYEQSPGRPSTSRRYPMRNPYLKLKPEFIGHFKPNEVPSGNKPNFPSTSSQYAPSPYKGNPTYPPDLHGDSSKYARCGPPSHHQLCSKGSPNFQKVSQMAQHFTEKDYPDVNCQEMFRTPPHSLPNGEGTSSLESDHNFPKYPDYPHPVRVWNVPPEYGASCKPYEHQEWPGDQECHPQSSPSEASGSSRPLSKAARSENPSPKNCDEKSSYYFRTAPGIDIDQVAASIPQKDGSKNNLMKVALEAFNIRKTKPQMKQSDTAALSKGGSPAVNGHGKKKQQQYL